MRRITLDLRIRLCSGLLFLSAMLVPDVVRAVPALPRAGDGGEALPIPAGTNAFTWAQFKPEYERSMRSLFAVDFDRYAGADPAADRDTKALLEDMSACFAAEKDPQAISNLLVRARAVAARGGTHPLLWYACGTLSQSVGDIAEAKRCLLLAAVRLLDDPACSSYRKAMVCAALAEVYRTHRFIQEDLQRTWSYRAIAHMKDALARDPACRQASPRFLLGALESHGSWVMVRPNSPLTDTVAAGTNIDAWLSLMVQGRARRDEAWKARGSGFGESVAPAGWREFHAKLSEAREAFTRAWELHPEYPEAASDMIAVAMAAPLDDVRREPRRWFDRAMAAQMDYLPAYTAYLWSLRPRWGGSLRSVYAFGVECLDTGRFDTQVPLHFLRALRDAAADAAGDDAASRVDWWTAPGVFTNLCRMCEGYLAVAPPAQAPYFRTVLAVGAWRCGRYGEADGLLRRSDADLREDVAWDIFGVRLAAVREETAARTGGWWADLVAIDQLLATDAGAALGKIDALAAARGPAASTLARPLDQRRKRAAQQLALDRGEWVDLIPAKDLDGWQELAGGWRVESNGMVVGASSKAGLMLRNALRIGADATVEFETESVSAVYADKVNAGILLAGGADNTNSFSVVLQHGDGTVEHGVAFGYREKRANKMAPRASVNHATLRIAEGRFNLAVNGRPIFDAALAAGSDLRPPLSLAIGGSYWYDETLVRYRSLRVRRNAAPRRTPRRSRGGGRRQPACTAPPVCR